MANIVLVTGFQPFDGQSMNPAWEAVLRLPDTIGDSQIAKAQLPVVFGKAPAKVEEAINEFGANLVLCVGQAGGRAKITPEFVGINYMDARIPDNDGNQPVAKKIEPNGPDAYFSTLHVRTIAEGLAQKGVPAEVSYSAGTYVCNDVLYSLLHTLKLRHPGVRGGFIHVPFATEQAAHMASSVPSMSIKTMVRGLELAIQLA